MQQFYGFETGIDSRYIDFQVLRNIKSISYRFDIDIKTSDEVSLNTII